VYVVWFLLVATVTAAADTANKALRHTIITSHVHAAVRGVVL
jgi:hypothetical protein